MSRTTTWGCVKDVPVRAQSENWGDGPRQGAPKRTALYAGRLDNRAHKSYLDFAVDFTDIGAIVGAWFVFYTRTVDGFAPGSTAKVRVYRLTKEFTEPAGDTGWDTADDVNPTVATGTAYVRGVNRTENGETRLSIKALVEYWKAHSDLRHGIRVDTPENTRSQAFAFWSDESSNPLYRPFIEVEYEPPNFTPDIINTISPSGDVPIGTPFRGQFGDPNGDRPAKIEIEVRKTSNNNTIWNPDRFPFDPAWIEEFGVWTWEIANPGSSKLSSKTAYEWRARGLDPGAKVSAWTPYRAFRLVGTDPTITPRPVGSRATLVGYTFKADFSTGTSASPASYRIQCRRASDPWTSPLWDETIKPLSASEKTAGVTSKTYTGPRLLAGDYVWRIELINDEGVSSGFSADDPFTLTVGSEADTDDGTGPPVNSSGYARDRARVRIVIRDNDGKNNADPPVANRGPGTIKAIIEDAINIGCSTVVNEGGEFYFTLPADHPQAGECEPWQRHYALQQYRNGNWYDIHNGLLVDFDAGDNDIVVYGYDYMGVLSRSIDTRYPPKGSNSQADHAHGGAKYKDEYIHDVIKDQLQAARDAKDSPLQFITTGVIEDLTPKITILSSFKQRLFFIRGLIESSKQGSGNRTRLRPRQDPSQKDRWEWDLRRSPGKDRDNLRLEYGSLLQNFRVIAMGTDYSTRAHGIGTEPDSVKPFFSVDPPASSSSFLTDLFGNLQRVEIFQDVNDENDLKRRVKQMLREASKVGQRINMAIRVHGINPFDGYDLTDNIPIDIDYGLVKTDAYGSGYWTLWGLEWRLFPDGHDELTWAVKPRLDDEDPDPSLIPSLPIHNTPEWEVGHGNPPPEPALSATRFYLDIDSGTVYERVPTNDAEDTYGWTVQGTIPGDGSGTGTGPPPDAPMITFLDDDIVVQPDGTVVTSLIISWTGGS